MAAPAMAKARQLSRAENWSDNAASACNTLYQIKLAVRSFFRSQPDTQAANTGAPRQVNSAELEINWPAVATETFKDVLTSVSTPVAIIHNASLPTQRQALATLGQLAATIEAQQLHSPSVIVVGDVVQGATAWQAQSAALPVAEQARAA